MTLSITADSSDPTEPPSVRLVAASTTGGPSPIPANTLIEVWRNHEDGSRHRVLTEQGPRLIGGGWASIDPHAPFNQPVTYDIVANGFTATSNTAWLPCSDVWVIPASDSELAVKVPKVTNIADRSSSSRSQKFTPIGGKSVYLTDGVRDGMSGAITILVPADDEPTLMELFASDEPVLINTPGPDRGWWLWWMWVQPLDIKWSNPANWTGYEKRSVTIAFEETADPDLDLEPVWDWEDLAAAFPAGWNAVDAAYVDWVDVATDTRV